MQAIARQPTYTELGERITAHYKSIRDLEKAQSGMSKADLSRSIKTVENIRRQIVELEIEQCTA